MSTPHKKNSQITDKPRVAFGVGIVVVDVFAAANNHLVSFALLLLAKLCLSTSSNECNTSVESLCVSALRDDDNDDDGSLRYCGEIGRCAALCPGGDAVCGIGS